MTPDGDTFERIPIYGAEGPESDLMTRFKEQWGNQNFRPTWMTWLTLFVLLIFYPGISVGFAEDPSVMLKNLNSGMLMVLLIVTIVFQWVIFAIMYGAIWTEGTGLRGIGFQRIRAIDFGWAVAFLLAANLILAGLAWLLAQIGLPMPGEIAMLIPQDWTGRIVWVLVSFTAGFCEETAFRGYLMTRLRLVGKTAGWLIPTLISAVAFGACHAYQGWPGFIVITVYGVLFSLLYIRTGRIWPCIIAHFFQDFSALFIPQ